MIRNIVVKRAVLIGQQQQVTLLGGNRKGAVLVQHEFSSIAEGIRIPTTTSAVSLLSGDYSSPAGGGGRYQNQRHGGGGGGGRQQEDDEATAGALFEEREERDRAAAVAKEEEAKIKQLRKWLENARPPVRTQAIDDKGRAYGKGARKTAKSQAWVYPGEGNITINGKDFVDYFKRQSDRELVLMPFVATQTCSMFDVNTKVSGGGLTGQAGAVRLGIARALQNYNPDLRPPMKVLGLLTRDPRMVERKKTGLKKARKAPQWVKR